MLDPDEVPILVTTAISPPSGVPFLQMADQGRRKITTKAAIWMWASYGARRIVIADSTGHEILCKSEINELTSYGIDIEQIFFQQDPSEILSRGKGFAEGRIINFALENSNLINKYRIFFKSTGKTFVRNYSILKNISRENKIRRFFWSRIVDDFASEQNLPILTNGNEIDTRFFLTDLEFASNILVPHYSGTDDTAGKHCEKVIYEACSMNLQPVRSPRPLVAGFCGGSGREYFDGTLGAIDGNAMAWAGFAP